MCKSRSNARIKAERALGVSKRGSRAGVGTSALHKRRSAGKVLPGAGPVLSTPALIGVCSRSGQSGGELECADNAR